ncbi:MAG TPA: hypothetical protein VHQ45_03695 [Gemmatimonadaceae bacterium]|nr:hypothetical protein [Gemmatimonadaceae bacterium]
MTVPLLTLAPPPAPAAAPSPVSLPLGWLLDTAALPIQYRAITEVAPLDESAQAAVRWMPYAYERALALVLAQHPDGTWGNAMLRVPTEHDRWPAGVGTITAVRRLLEWGWGQDSPPLLQARRVLFRLLAEDDDPAYLYEFAGEAKSEDMVRRGRSILREAAAAVLAQAGYERDPRLRGAAQRILGRVTEYLRSPSAAKPWIRVGNRQVLPADAAPPSTSVLSMLAYMPLFRSEHADSIDLIYEHLIQPMPRQEPVQVVGDDLVLQPHLVLGDQLPHRNAADADIPSALAWLETMARLGFLKRHEAWCKLFERFLDERGRDGIWHPRKDTVAPKSDNPFVWSYFPLDVDAAGEARWTDVTFRLALIAKLMGRPIQLV